MATDVEPVAAPADRSEIDRLLLELFRHVEGVNLAARRLKPLGVSVVFPEKTAHTGADNPPRPLSVAIQETSL